jgi:hypothetical protein
MVTDFWIGFVSSTAGIGAVTWLAKTVIVTRLTKSVQHEFDRKIEGIKGDIRKSEEVAKADLRRSEEVAKADLRKREEEAKAGFQRDLEVLKVDLREKETRISSMQSTLLSTISTRRAAMDKARLEACTLLWTSAERLHGYRGMLQLMHGVGIRELAEVAKRRTDTREWFKRMLSGFTFESFGEIKTQSARLYVSDKAWALYSTMQMMIAVAFVWQVIVEHGQDPDLMQISEFRRSMQELLPQHATEIASGKHDLNPAYWDQLAENLLVELRFVLDGKSIDSQDMTHSAELIKGLTNLAGRLDQTEQETLDPRPN